MRTLLIICILLFPTSGFSQSDDPYVYGEIGMGVGKYTMYQGSVNCILKERHSVSLSYYRNWRNAEALPSDYEGWLISFGKPNDKLIFMAATYGRVVVLTNITRLNLKAGPLFGTYRYLSDFVRSAAWFSPNYTYTRYRENTYGLLFNPSFELSFTNTWGLSMGGHVLVTNNQYSYAIQAALIAGSLRKALKDKNFE